MNHIIQCKNDNEFIMIQEFIFSIGGYWGRDSGPAIWDEFGLRENN